jgi:ankyrin repeat protein
MHAAWMQHIAIMEELLDCGAEIEAVDSNGWTALRFAVEFGSVGSEHCACVLLFRGANPNAKDRQGVRVAAKAAERGMEYFLSYCRRWDDG